jgi:hypothetical protein
MATEPETGTHWSGVARKLMVPAAIAAAGSAVGLLLTKRQKLRAAAPKLREAVSDLRVPHIPEGGVGEFAGDLRGKVDEVLGREPTAKDEGGSSGDGASSGDTKIDRSKLQQRRRERQERRDRRQQRSRR